MNKRKDYSSSSTSKAYVSISDVCNFTGLGRGAAEKLAAEANAKIKFGGRNVYSLELIQKQMEKMRIKQNNK